MAIVKRYLSFLILFLFLLHPSTATAQTRLYLPSSGTVAISPALGGASSPWTRNRGSITRFPLVTTKTGTTSTELNLTSSATAPDVSLFQQWVKCGLVAGTISGTVRMNIRVRENNNAYDGTVAMELRVTDSLGTTVRGTILPLAYTTNVTAAPPEITSSFPGRTRLFRDSSDNTSVTLTNVAAQAGDCLVAEVGLRENDTATSHTGWIAIGDEQVSDLSDTEGVGGDVDNAPFIEFSGNLFGATVTRHNLSSTGAGN